MMMHDTTSPWCNILVVRNPGLGKSFIALYKLYRLLQNSDTIVYECLPIDGGRSLAVGPTPLFNFWICHWRVRQPVYFMLPSFRVSLHRSFSTINSELWANSELWPPFLVPKCPDNQGFTVQVLSTESVWEHIAKQFEEQWYWCHEWQTHFSLTTT